MASAARRRSNAVRPPDPAPLLLASGLGLTDVRRLLAPYGITDVKRADANLQELAGEPRSRELLATFLKHLLTGIGGTADPDQALTHWERYAAAAGHRPSLFGYLRESPRMLDLLCVIFGNSPALADTMIRDPALVYWLAEEQVLDQQPSRQALQAALHAMIGNVTATELKLEALRRFRRREMLRIGVRDLLRVATVTDTMVALSRLAEVLIQGALDVVETDLREAYGTPMHRGREGKPAETGFAVIAMGKLGGGELNYSSDVDLLYVYDTEEGDTRPGKGCQQKSIPNEEYFELLARRLTAALADRTQEGYVYRVDLRLRPEGRMGSLARSLASYARYYETRGQLWERQALLKAWPIAGSRSTGRAFLRVARRAVARGTAHPGGEVLAEINAIKARIDERVSDRGHERRNVKLGIGGIREIEFIVQAAQLLLSSREPAILQRNTLRGLDALRPLLNDRRDVDRLVRAYEFLRDVEHKLQMVHDLQTHALPETDQEITRCAIRLGYRGRGAGEASRRRFMRDVRRHTGVVHAAFLRMMQSSRSPLLRVSTSKAG